MNEVRLFLISIVQHNISAVITRYIRVMSILRKYQSILFFLLLQGMQVLHAQTSHALKWNILLETQDKTVNMTTASANEVRRSVNAKLATICKDSVPLQGMRFQGNKVSLIISTAADTSLLVQKLSYEASFLFLSPYPMAILDRVKNEIQKLDEKYVEKRVILAPTGEKNAQIGICQVKDTTATEQLFAQLSRNGIIPPDGKVYYSNRPKDSEAFGITHGVHLLNKTKPILQGNFVKTATTTFNNGSPIVHIQLNASATKILIDYSRKHVGEVIGVIINGKIVMDPFIYGPIVNGTITLNGLGTTAQTKEIADQISNQYPTPMKLIGIFPVP